MDELFAEVVKLARKLERSGTPTHILEFAVMLKNATDTAFSQAGWKLLAAQKELEESGNLRITDPKWIEVSDRYSDALFDFVREPIECLDDMRLILWYLNCDEGMSGSNSYLEAFLDTFLKGFVQANYRAEVLRAA